MDNIEKACRPLKSTDLVLYAANNLKSDFLYFINQTICNMKDAPLYTCSAMANAVVRLLILPNKTRYSSCVNQNHMKNASVFIKNIKKNSMHSLLDLYNTVAIFLIVLKEMKYLMYFYQ